MDTTTDIQEILHDLNVDPKMGISDSEIENRKEKYGVNEIEAKKRDSLLIHFLKELKNPLNAILIAAGFLTLFLGEHIDMFVIFAAVLVNIFIAMFQEARTNKTFQKLNQSKIFDVLMRRNGKKEVLPAKELVVGDIVFINPGDKIPADCHVIKENDIAVDESSFTGEAENVHKKIGDLAFSGSIVKRGSALVVVSAVGEYSEFGQILKELNDIQKKPSAIAQKMKKLTFFIGIIALVAIVLVILGGVYTGLSIYTLLVLGISVAVSAIPEGLGASVSAALTVGMHRLLKKGILVKDLVSAETMASVDTILTDKTGTLTKGEMSLRESYIYNNEIEEKDFLLSAYLGSDVSYDAKHEQFVGDEMDIAIAQKLIESGYFDDEEVYNEFSEKYETLKILPFSSEKKYFARLVKEKASGKYFIYVKGAPEIILGAADNLSEGEKNKERKFLHEKQGSENRFLGFGKREVSDISDLENFELNLEGISLTAFASFLDPLKESVGVVLDKVKKMDLNLIMITGDSKEVALSVAEKTGLAEIGEDVCLEGKDIQDLSKDELYDMMMDKTKIFARVSPKDKLKLTQTFIERGHRIAMTGDGVNDVLAISQADIGITFANASEAAREAASLVLKKNDFSLILAAVDEARNIIKNIRKTVIYLLSSSFSEVLVILGALLIGGPMPFLAVHILWANIVEEGLLNFAFIFGKNKSDGYVGRINSKILTKKVKRMMAAVGLVDGLLLLGLYFYLFKSGFSEVKIQSLMFLALSLNFSVVAYALTDLQKTIFRKDVFSNRYLNISVLIGLSLIAAAVLWQPLQNLLHLEPYTQKEIWYLIGFSFVNLAFVELFKWIIFHKKTHKKTN